MGLFGIFSRVFRPLLSARPAKSCYRPYWRRDADFPAAYYDVDKEMSINLPGCKEKHMKLSLIAASVLTYTLLAAAWICQADLQFLY